MRPSRTNSRVKLACFSQPSLCVGERWLRWQTNDGAEVDTPYAYCRTDGCSFVA